jgi:succinylglutamate desuccinylase
MKDSDIYKIESGKSGPTVAIFAGVHGNELAGVFALRELLPSISILKGTLYIAFANPKAIKAEVRMLNKNLNRCFYESNAGLQQEDVRARELMTVLDSCEALLDLHMFYDDNGTPFVICEENALEIANLFKVDIISTNWSSIEPGGSDGYMYSKGKIGICVECGPISKAKEYTEFAKLTIFQFLNYFGMTNVKVPPATNLKRLIKAEYAVYKNSADFVLNPGFKNFESLMPGKIIAIENSKQYKANLHECIIFPHYNARLHEEVYIIGKEI